MNPKSRFHRNLKENERIITIDDRSDISDYYTQFNFNSLGEIIGIYENNKNSTKGAIVILDTGIVSLGENSTIFINYSDIEKLEFYPNLTKSNKDSIKGVCLHLNFQNVIIFITGKTKREDKEASGELLDVYSFHRFLKGVLDDIENGRYKV